MTTKTKRRESAAVEWVGGVVSMPAYVTGEGDPYRPELLVWMGSDGKVLGSTTGKPGEVLRVAGESLKQAIARPLIGAPHAPLRLRVASSDLAAAVRGAHPELEVLCAPTPEIDHMLAMMRDHMIEDADEEQSYLTPEIPPDAVGAFFRAAASLFRAGPWKHVPDDQSVFSVTVEKLGIRAAALSIIGQMGESFGFVLFSSFDDFESYLDVATDVEPNEKPVLPAHLALNFERGADLSPALRKEIAEHGWEVAGPNAYPWLYLVDPDLIARPPGPRDLTIAEAIALALPPILAEKRALDDAWSGNGPIERKVVVSTHLGELELTVRVPHEREAERPEPSDVLDELRALAEHGDEIDSRARRRLEDALMRQFVASPEGESLPDVGACQFVMDFADESFDETIATLRSPELRTILFELVPRKVSITAAAVQSIIQELRAFYTFLKHEFELPQADECLRVLGPDAERKLEAALSDRTKFGMAKSLMMAGREAGFDMESKQGIEAWMRVVESRGLPGVTGFPALNAPPAPPRSGGYEGEQSGAPSSSPFRPRARGTWCSRARRSRVCFALKSAPFTPAAMRPDEAPALCAWWQQQNIRTTIARQEQKTKRPDGRLLATVPNRAAVQSKRPHGCPV